MVYHVPVCSVVPRHSRRPWSPPTLLSLLVPARHREFIGNVCLEIGKQNKPRFSSFLGGSRLAPKGQIGQR